jgi:hypothetical protein
MGSTPRFSISVPKEDIDTVRQKASDLMKRLATFTSPIVTTQSGLFRAAIDGKLTETDDGVFLSIKVADKQK